MSSEVWGGVSLVRGQCPFPGTFFHLGLKMRILVHCAAHLSPDLQYICLPTLTFQADCGSIKGAGVPTKEGTEHYLPW